ncbi:hypothetical protein TNCV_5074601 [Trichonephila clavipes]|nr:hypothetical protein TNCV_5074601 [Trichonephila clavipes]
MSFRRKSYASLLPNSEPDFLNTCVVRSRVKRKMWTADKCDQYIVRLKKEAIKWMADRWSTKGLHYRGDTQKYNTIQNMKAPTCLLQDST